MIEETANWEGMSPREKLESARGQYLVAQAMHYGLQQMMRSRKYGDRIGIVTTCAKSWKVAGRSLRSIFAKRTVDGGTSTSQG